MDSTMKKSVMLILSILISLSGFSQSYSTELNKLNEYLKTFDNGYYGYLEISGGYLYDRFPSGKHTKTLMTDLDKAVVETINQKVIVKCKDDKSCVFSTYTDSYHKYMSYSQSTGFNTSELVTLFNNFINAYNNKTINNSTSTNSNITNQTKGELLTKLENTSSELNDFLSKLDNGRYKGIEVKDGYIISHYQNWQSSKAKIEDIDYVKANTEYNYVKLACKGDAKCVYSTITSGYHDYFNFNTGAANLTKTETLLNNFLTSLKNYLSSEEYRSTKSVNNKQADRSTQSPSSRTEENKAGELKYSSALNNLNDYLNTFNSKVYKGVEVKEGKVYFNFFVFGALYSSNISVDDLVKNTILIIGKSAGSTTEDEVKILCKSGSNCFYSTYSKGPTDHFRFFSHSVKDFAPMKQKLEEFINSLK